MNNRSYLVTLILQILLLGGCVERQPLVPPSQYVSTQEITVAGVVQEAQSLFQRGRYLDAELRLRQAQRLYPQVLSINLNLAAVLARTGHVEEADQVYQKMLLRDPNSSDLVKQAARSFHKVGELERAAEYFNRIIPDTESAQDAQLARERANLSFQGGMEEEALCWSTAAYGLSPTVDEAVRHLRVLLSLARYSQAHAVIAAMTDGAASPRIRYIKALIEFEVGDEALARTALSDLQVQITELEDFRQEAQLIFSALFPVESEDEDDVQPRELIVTSDMNLTLPPRMLAHVVQGMAVQSE